MCEARPGVHLSMSGDHGKVVGDFCHVHGAMLQAAFPAKIVHCGLLHAISREVLDAEMGDR
jgi:hypothetical protein